MDDIGEVIKGYQRLECSSKDLYNAYLEDEEFFFKKILGLAVWVVSKRHNFLKNEDKINCALDATIYLMEKLKDNPFIDGLYNASFTTYCYNFLRNGVSKYLYREGKLNHEGELKPGGGHKGSGGEVIEYEWVNMVKSFFRDQEILIMQRFFILKLKVNDKKFSSLMERNLFLAFVWVNRDKFN